MKLKLALFPKPVKWDEVREQILKAIEEEERRNTTIFIQSAGDSIFIDRNQPQIDNKRIRVTVGTTDSGFACGGGTQ